MTIKVFATRPVEVEAVQVTGEDAVGEILAWTKDNGVESWPNSRFRPGGIAESFGVQIRGKDGQRRNAEEGYWVVLMGEKDFRIFTDEFFTANFDSMATKGRHGEG